MRRIQYNSPVVLTFALLSLAVLGLDKLTGGVSTKLCFETYRAPFTDPLMYVRLLGHVLGHANFAHYAANMTLFLQHLSSPSILATSFFTSLEKDTAIYLPGQVFANL